MAQRVGLGVARNGGLGEHTSGDLFFAFSSANETLTACDVKDWSLASTIE